MKNVVIDAWNFKKTIHMGKNKIIIIIIIIIIINDLKFWICL